jgi:tRNA-dihydrouridine synthase
MGCPVRKVTHGGAGSALLADPPLAGRIVRATVRGAEVPVTVKIRSGFGKDSGTYVDVAGEAFGAGAAAVTLHPRSRGQMFSGSADWSQIAALKKEFPDRIVIGNGDVRTPEDARRILDETGCDAVMVGRAALGDPWIFRAMRQAVGRTCGLPGAPSGRGDDLPPVAPAPSMAPATLGHPWPSPAPARDERRALILRHGEEMHRLHGDAGIRLMRKHLAWYSRGFPGAAAFRAELVRVSTIESFRAAVGRRF